MSANEEEPYFWDQLEWWYGYKNIINIKDLQTLIQKSMGDDVTVVHYRTSSLVPKNEKYGSRVTKVSVYIKAGVSSIQKLSLMAKMSHASEFQAKYLNNTASFSKEIFFYETLIPAYETLLSCKPNFKISPKYYGGRLTMNQTVPDVADDDAVLLTENLKSRGYYAIQKYFGLYFCHAKKAIIVLARFHALGMAVKVKNPELFDAAKKYCDVQYNFYAENISETIDHLVDIVCKHPTVAKYREKIIFNMRKNNWKVWLLPNEQDEPWVTIIHGDFWVKNILFRNIVKGVVDDSKMIDFQLAKIGSPQADLIYFLCVSLHCDLIEGDVFDELLSIYYLKFIRTLCITGVDTTAFSRESFDQHLQNVARGELFHCLMRIKFVTYGCDIDFNQRDAMILQCSNISFETRASLVALMFIEKDWL